MSYPRGAMILTWMMVAWGVDAPAADSAADTVYRNGRI